MKKAGIQEESSIFKIHFYHQQEAPYRNAEEGKGSKNREPGDHNPAST